jgi:hypothetical protein
MILAAIFLTVGVIVREVGSFNYKNIDIMIAGVVMMMTAP